MGDYVKKLSATDFKAMFPGVEVRRRKRGIKPVVELFVTDPIKQGTVVNLLRAVRVVHSKMADLDEIENRALKEMRDSNLYENLPKGENLGCWKRMPMSTIQTWSQPKGELGFYNELIIANIARCYGSYKKPYEKEISGTTILDKAQMHDLFTCIDDFIVDKLSTIPDNLTLDQYLEYQWSGFKRSRKTWRENAVKRRKMN